MRVKQTIQNTCLCNRFSFYILSCPRLYTLLYTNIFLPPFYTLSYIYSYILHIPAYFTPLLYILLYIPSLIYLLYTFLYTLSYYSLIVLLILPRRFYTYSLLYTILLYTYPPHFSPLSCILSTTPHLIYCYTHSLIWKGYNYAAADFYTLYIAISIFTAALISQLSYYIAFKEWKRRRQELQN